jgi:3-methyladenine DNA glycosylase AlkD
MRTTDPKAAAKQARLALARMARPVHEFDAARYFRSADGLGFFNIGTERVRALAQDVVRQHREQWTVNDACLFADTLMADRFLEVKGLGIEVLARYRRDFTPRLLSRWKSWLRRNLSANWATTDGICGSLIGPLLVSFPHLIPQVSEWSRDRNLWVRRASAVSLLASIRNGTALDEAYAVARGLHHDKEDLIQKAVGWMLREAGKVDSKRLEVYLRKNGPSIPRTTVRYAIERFSEAKRSDLLRATHGT